MAKLFHSHAVLFTPPVGSFYPLLKWTMVDFARRQGISHFFKIQIRNPQSLCPSGFKVPFKDLVWVTGFLEIQAARKGCAWIFIGFFSVDSSTKTALWRRGLVASASSEHGRTGMEQRGLRERRRPVWWQVLGRGTAGLSQHMGPLT